MSEWEEPHYQTTTNPFVQPTTNNTSPTANSQLPPTKPTSFPSTTRQQSTASNYPKDIIEGLLHNVNQDLLMSKVFYFFFFAAFGSLFPLLGVYFKQMGMNATQGGILMGIRPLIEFVSSPFWGGIADKFHKGKLILLSSLVCWILFTMSLSFIQPPASSCIAYNDTHHMLLTPYNREKRTLIDTSDDYDEVVHSLEKRNGGNPAGKHSKGRQKAKPMPPNYVVGKSPNTVEYTFNYDQERHISYISPPFSSIVYKSDDVQAAFFLMLLLVVIGEYFSAPAITLADSVTLSYLGENTDHYGRQRMFGSLGWGISMFFLGIALDHSTSFPNHPCGPLDKERNYTICFATFSVLMGCAFITATQFRFEYDNELDVTMKQVQPQHHDANKPITIEDIAPGIPVKRATDDLPESREPVPPKSLVFAQTMRKLPEIYSVTRSFATPRYAAFLFVTWFMGFGIGLVFTFLFWHLQDLGGTPTLFGVASVINHISEIFAFFFSFRFIKQMGHVKVLCIGLVCNVLRFLYISWLSNPWWILPFEFFQGVTHAAVWAASCSYITQATPEHLRSNAMGVLQGLHHGLGRACGAIFGGMVISSLGTQVTFRLYGVLCIFVLLGFVFINYYRRDVGFFSFKDEEVSQVIVEESSHLAPHGVPSGPMARSLSKQNLQQQTNNDSYQASTQGGFLGVPGSQNDN